MDLQCRNLDRKSIPEEGRKTCISAGNHQYISQIRAYDHYQYDTDRNYGCTIGKIIGSASDYLILPGICLILTAIILFMADHIKIGEKTEETASYKDAVILGLAQGVATLPGLSRSGTTITACLIRGFNREFAVKYSFIMSIPAILGAMVLQLKDFTVAEFSGGLIWNYLAGMIVAGVVGYLCIKAMLLIVKKNKFTVFSIYCLIVGIASVVCYFVL